MYVISSMSHFELPEPRLDDISCGPFLLIKGLTITSRFEHLCVIINFFVAASNLPVFYKYSILHCR